ncbi:MAG: hypothetical protein JW913_09020 [Chitinispirillaceae bacterium]|nr:hypothetical protein [Chitinispirillaceae bacterium]
MTERIIAILCLAALAGLLSDCTQNVSGVETTNGNGFTVTATALTIEGTAPPFSQVFVFDTSYIPYIDSGVGIVTSADRDGNYRITTSPGCYNVFVVTPDGAAAGVTAEMVADENRRNTSSQLHTMERPGSISGSIAETTDDPLLVYLAGMCHYTLISNRRDFHFITVPPGNYRLRIARLSWSAGTIVILHDREISVKQGEAVQAGEIN